MPPAPAFPALPFLGYALRNDEGDVPQLLMLAGNVLGDEKGQGQPEIQYCQQQ